MKIRDRLYYLKQFVRPTHPFILGDGTDTYYRRRNKTTTVADNQNVMACIRYITNAALKAPPVVRRGKEGAIIENHPLSEAFLHPNPNTTHSLWMKRIITAFIVNGNSYALIKQRGNELEFKYLPYERVSFDERKQVYRYRAKNEGVSTYQHSDILHLRYAVAEDSDMGVSPLRGTVLEEIKTDEEALEFIYAILHNNGIPGLILKSILGSNREPSPSEIEMARKAIDSLNGRDRGKVLSLLGNFEIQELSGSVERWNLDFLRYSPRAAVCGALGVPPRLAMLNTGVNQVGWGNTLYEERKEAFWNTVVPMLVVVAEQVQEQIVRLIYDPTGMLEVFDFDYTASGFEEYTQSEDIVDDNQMNERNGNGSENGETEAEM